MIMIFFRYLLLFAVLAFIPSCSFGPLGASSGGKGVVVLDIGHYLNGTRGTGAMSPVMRDGTRIEETAFWYKYARYVKEPIEDAGYECVVTNRGRQPLDAGLAACARKTPVLQLNRPDTRASNGKPSRYPSRFHPEHIAAGLISADFAIWKKADCVVFLHQDSATDSWSRIYKSTILHNARNGRPLAEFIARSLNASVLGNGGGRMPNGGKACRTEPRSNADLGGAAWLNTCDASGIPATVVEAAMLSNPDHVYWLAQEENAIRFARAVGQGVAAYLKAAGK